MQVVYNKELAMRSLNEGDVEAAKIYMFQSLQARKMGLKHLEMSIKMNSIVNDVQVAMIHGNVAINMVKINRLLKGDLMKMDTSTLLRRMTELEVALEELSIQQEVINDSVGGSARDDVSNEDLEKAMSSLLVDQSVNDHDIYSLPIMTTVTAAKNNGGGTDLKNHV